MLIKDSYTVECLKPFLPVPPLTEISVPYDVDLGRLLQTAILASNEATSAIATCLKIGVEHSADTDPDIARTLADTIIAIGNGREDGSLVGLGTLAHGDILAHAVKNVEAWDKLEEAGEIYLKAGDKFGWARTRINRLFVSAELCAVYDGVVEHAFADAAAAEQIFLDANRYDRLMRLYHAWAYACYGMGRYEQAIFYYEKAIAVIEQSESGQNTPILIASLWTDIGRAYNALGELSTAMDYLAMAREVFLGAGHEGPAAMAGAGMAINYATRGKFRQAMHLLLNSVLPNLNDQRADAARMTLVECLIALNRDHEAHALAYDLVETSKSDANRHHLTAMGALLLSTIEMRLGQFSQAHASLELAETNFHEYESMVTLIQLRRGQVALRQGDAETARTIAESTATLFRRWQQPMNWIEAAHLGAEAALLAGDFVTAEHLSFQALRYARQFDVEPACYRSYAMLAQILDRQGRRHSTIRVCRAALAVLEQMQRTLTLSLRSGFMEDKLLPFHLLMRLYLTGGQTANAFATLERLKAQVSLDFVSHREQLTWVQNDQTRPLLDQLERLRDKHRWLTRIQLMPPAEEGDANPWYRDISSYTNLFHATAACEREIRQLTEQLYLFAEQGWRSAADILQLDDIQRQLDDSTILVEFYGDRERVWCIGITNNSTICHSLPGSMADIQHLIADKWQSNLAFALNVGPLDPLAHDLASKARRLGEKLYLNLLEPLQADLKGKRRIVIVPYGVLHQLPFNILCHDGKYLIETHELVILPAAALIMHRVPDREAGATVLAHSWDGRLTFSAAEGQAVHQIMGGTLHLEADASRELLKQTPRQVLHVSTHGEHRIDQPDFSYIELADGPVYTDDLVQCDLSYELIVLSACEVGRSNVNPGEELIGLGRGFLYAGAGALITSLWRVNEEHTFLLMQALYQALRPGESKARALQTAQCELLARNPDLHPAFWAAFQLICNPDPLSAA